MEAEAAALRLGMALVLALFTHPGSLHVAGDNLPIIRLAAANGKLRADRIWHALERPIMHALGQGWRCQWSAVRRHRNKVADHLATRGTLTAVDMGSRGVLAPQVWVWVSPDACLRPSPCPPGRLPWHDGMPIDTAPAPLCPLDLSR